MMMGKVEIYAKYDCFSILANRVANILHRNTVTICINVYIRVHDRLHALNVNAAIRQHPIYENTSNEFIITVVMVQLYRDLIPMIDHRRHDLLIMQAVWTCQKYCR
jgi:hypothetical protein